MTKENFRIKRAGIIMTAAGLILFPLSMYDLFGDKNLPTLLTITGFLSGLASTFLGPAIYVFAFSKERRKKITRRSLILSLSLIISGIVFLFMQWPGARMQVIFGVLIFSFFYGALAFKNKYEKWRIYARSKYDALFLSLFDFIGIGSLFLGFLFRIQHWPMAELLICIGFITLGIGVVAWNQKFKKEVVYRKETEDKLQESYKEIELQHEKLEEKQKEIIDSINYAKRIQQSHMATEKYIESSLKRLNKK